MYMYCVSVCLFLTIIIDVFLNFVWRSSCCAQPKDLILKLSEHVRKPPGDANFRRYSRRRLQYILVGNAAKRLILACQK